jgi:hypothetical protein
MLEELVKNVSWSQSLNFKSWFKPIIDYSRKKVVRYGANYMAFAFFMTLNYTVPFFMHTHAGPDAYKWVLAIKALGTLLCVGLFLEPYWPTWLKKHFATYWHFSLLYCLPFSFTFLFLVNGSNVEWLVNVSLAITLLIVLADWRTFILTFILGTTLALWCYHQFIGTLPFLDLENWYILIYTCLFAMIVGLVFVRRKELDLDFLILNNLQLSEIQKKTQNELIQAINYREELFKELNPDEIALFDSATAAYIKQAVYRVKNYLRLSVRVFQIDELLQSIQANLKAHALGKNNSLIIQNHAQKQELEADFDQLKQLIINGIIYVQQHAADGRVRLVIEDAVLGHGISYMEGYTRKLEALRLVITLRDQVPSLEPFYKMKSSEITSNWVPDSINELPLLENERIIDAHYGYMDIEDPQTHIYVVPVHVREVRGKVMELLREEAAADPEELNHPLAIELEEKLINKLQGTRVDIEVVKKALNVIKKYHGGVKRKSGEPFFTHPMQVALILLEYSQDQDAVLAALLHDTVEDTSLSMAHIRVMFGDRVAFLVGKATNLEDDLRRVSLQEHENLYRLINYEDERAALVKLADRLHNMRTIQGHTSLAKQKRIAQETLTFFVPLSRQLKLESMSQELERIGLEIMSK